MQRALDRGPGRVAAGVDDAPAGVAALTGAQEQTVGVPVEFGTPVDEGRHRVPAVGEDEARRRGIGETATGGDRVGEVAVNGIGVVRASRLRAGHHDRDTTLRVKRGRGLLRIRHVPARPLVEHDDPEPLVGGPERRRQSGDSGTHHHEVGADRLRGPGQSASEPAHVNRLSPRLRVPPALRATPRMCFRFPVENPTLRLRHPKCSAARRLRCLIVSGPDV